MFVGSSVHGAVFLVAFEMGLLQRRCLEDCTLRDSRVQLLREIRDSRIDGLLRNLHLRIKGSISASVGETPGSRGYQSWVLLHR